MKEQVFKFILKSGFEVEIKFTFRAFGKDTDNYQVHHFEFRGKTISETGYRSHYIFKDQLEEDIEKQSFRLAQELENDLISKNAMILNALNQFTLF
jgi:hypothetical protein